MTEAAFAAGRQAPDGVRVSYILSTRNRAPHLDRALSEARALVGPSDELIVVDGASTDGTAAVVEKHRDLVTLFLSQPDRGEAHGLNRGILKARGRYIKQITDDDVLFPEAMRRAVATLDSYPEIDALVCGGEASEIDPATGTTRTVEYRFLPRGMNLRDDVAHVLRYTQCGLGLVLRRSALERTGLFDVTFRAVDTDYMTRLIAGGMDVRYLDVKLFRHVTHPHSGQNLEAECLRDRARVLLRSGAWSRLEDAHDPLSLARAVGLDRLPHGEALARLIWQAEAFRRSRLGFLLRPVAAAADAVGGAVHLARRAARKVGLARRPGAVDLTVEPEWDGSLR